MRKSLKRFLLANLAGAVLAAGLTAGQSLKIGDPAPPLKVLKWLKGEPVLRFEPGHVYVVEFWATWCGPCIANMPHLTELQKKYAGKVTVIGVDSIEAKGKEDPESLVAKVDAFVAKKGDKMGYTVAVDDPRSNSTHEAWMKATFQTGIPASFVVDQKGNLAWLGHPAVGLDEAIAQTLDGTIDIAAGRAKQEKAAADNEVNAKISDALEKKRYEEVIALTDKVIAKGPKSTLKTSAYVIWRFMAMLHYDEARALAEARNMIADDKENLPLVGVYIAVDEGLSAQAYEYAADCLNKDLASKPNDVGHLAALARCYHLLDNGAKAVEVQEKAIQAALNDKNYAQNEDVMKNLRDELEKYKDALKHK